jgi:23S rRNA (uracil1939-C5)-methyltransferase
VTPRPDDHADVQTAVVDGFTHGGEGVVRLDGKAVFVPGALPAERVRVRVVERHRRWSRAELVEVLDAHAERVEPPCPLAEDCGGCDLQHAAPAHQVVLKTRVVREQLERIGRFDLPPVRPGRAVGPALGYRAHARMTAAPDGRLGFHRERSDEVVPVAHCPVLTPAAQALRELVGDGTGAVEVTLRADGVGDPSDGAVVLLPGPGPLDVPGGEHDLLLEQPDGSTAALRGDGVLHVPVGGVTYELPAGSFFQVSTEAAEAIVTEVLAAVGDVDGAATWDLYAGVGLLSVPLALAGADVVAVEGDGDALEAALRTAAAHDTTLRTVTGDVRDWLVRGATEGIDTPDVVVLDPPRTGVGQEASAALAALDPVRIVYVACDPAALARDARTLVDAGFRLRSVQPLDLFPMTHHVEAVALLTR